MKLASLTPFIRVRLSRRLVMVVLFVSVPGMVIGPLLLGQLASEPLRLSAMAAMTLILGLLVWLATQYVVAPIRTMSDLAQRIAAGNHTLRMPSTRTDELGELARAFNHMLSSLAEAHGLAESQRQELAAANQELTAEIARRRRLQAEAEALRLRTDLILSAAGDGIVGVDATGCVTFSNPAANEMLGWTQGELIGRGFHPLTHHTRSDGTPYTPETCPFYVVLRTGVPCRLAGEVLWRKDGSNFTSDCTASALRENGQITGAVFMIRDITERTRMQTALELERNRLQAQTALAQSDERYRTLVDHLPVGLCRATPEPDGVILMANPALAQILGYPSVEALQHIPARACYANPAERQIVSDRLLATGSIINERVHMVRADGTVFPGAITAYVVRDTAGQVLYFDGLIEDLTQRLAAETLEYERQGLRGAVTGMEQVLGIVAHELRTPLAGLRAISELLLDHDLRQTAEFDTFLSNINQETIRMGETVNGLLEAARINSGKAQWNWGDIALAETCEGALATIRPSIDLHHITLTLQVPPPEIRMRGDADAIQRLIVNLVSNAQKYTQQGEIGVQVRCVTEDGVAWVEIQVRDTGTGISPEIVQRIGEAFTLNSGMVGAHHVKGTGLGLAICKAIAAVHGGALVVRSAVGEGTTITARLRADLAGPVHEQAYVNFIENPTPQERHPEHDLNC